MQILLKKEKEKKYGVEMQKYYIQSFIFNMINKLFFLYGLVLFKIYLVI